MLMSPLISPMPIKACQHAARASRSSEDGTGRPGARAKFMRAIRSCFLAPERPAKSGLTSRPTVTCNSIDDERQLYHGADMHPLILALGPQGHGFLAGSAISRNQVPVRAMTPHLIEKSIDS